VFLRRGDEEFEIDSRPSDAIALAVRYDAPIFVSESILDTAAEE
jgi:bifunctional DNase/RNase